MDVVHPVYGERSINETIKIAVVEIGVVPGQLPDVDPIAEGPAEGGYQTRHRRQNRERIAVGDGYMGIGEHVEEIR